MRAADLIDPAARQHLETVVLEAERSTAGELVVAVVSACDPYASVGWRLGVAAAAAALVPMPPVELTRLVLKGLSMVGSCSCFEVRPRSPGRLR
jgi:hypothetical protein